MVVVVVVVVVVCSSIMRITTVRGYTYVTKTILQESTIPDRYVTADGLDSTANIMQLFSPPPRYS